MPRLSEDLVLSEALLLSETDDVLPVGTAEEPIGPPRLQFVLTDLHGVILSGLPGASAKTVGLSVGAFGTATATVSLDHDDADVLAAGDTLLQVLEFNLPGTNGPRLIFHGRQVTFEEVASGSAKTLAATWADPYWFAFRRHVGKSAAGYARGTALAQVDRSQIIGELLDALNAESTTRLAKGAITASSPTAVAGWSYKPMAEAVAELTATPTSPEWRVRPIPYTGGYIGALDVGPALGRFSEDAVFEYGDGALNVTEHRRIGTLEGAANRAFSLVASDPSLPAITVDNPASLAVRELMETTLSSDLTVDELRRQLALNHVTVRGGMRETLSLTVARDLGDGRVPRLGVDYDVGDVVPYRMSVPRRQDQTPALTTMAELAYPADDLYPSDTLFGGEVAVPGNPGPAFVTERRLDTFVRVYSAELTVDAEGGLTTALDVTVSA